MKKGIYSIFNKASKAAESAAFGTTKQLGRIAGAGVKGVLKGLHQGYQSASSTSNELEEKEQDVVKTKGVVKSFFYSILYIVFLPLAIENILFSLLIYLFAFAMLIGFSSISIYFIFNQLI